MSADLHRAYDAHRQQAAERQRTQTKSGQDIGTIPPIKDPIRRRDCMADFELYCKTYHPRIFNLPWAEYHKTTAAKIQQTVEYGGWYARALPRGGGKTTLCKCGILWAALRGTKKYPVIFAATEDLAKRLLRGIKMQLFTNELLFEDFPHAIYPIRRLGNEARRAVGQKYKGQPTFIEWGTNRLVLPWIDEEPSLSNGVAIETFGIESASRGLTCETPRGDILRPDIALADDPQTRASAKSPSQTQTRLEYLTGDVAYLPGPGESMSVFCPCTVIYEGDLADQILDREKHPEWDGERTKMVERFPDDMADWDKYADILREEMRVSKTLVESTAFYADRRKKMDTGFVVTWDERFDRKRGEISAIQHAMNLKIRDEAAFYAECQNEPIIAQDDLELLSADEICRKVTGYARGVVPDECSVVTAFTDIQIEHFFWMVCAWAPDFTGYVIDYGAWPDQSRNYFTRRDIRKRLSHIYTGDESGIVFGALTELGKKLAGTPYPKAGGGELALSRWCIDGNWRARESAVRAYAVQSEFRNIITLTYGKGIKASQEPFSKAQRAQKWRTTHGHWFWSDGPGPAKSVIFDTNVWKKRVHNALTLSTGSRGSIQLFKASPQVHRMLADHLLAEKPVKNESNGRTVYEWQEKPGQDNEGLDCLVGCALSASIAGVSADTERVRRPTKVLTLCEYASMTGGR